MNLTHGAVQTLVNSENHQSNPSFAPNVQIIMVKKVATQGGAGSERYRTIISDGQNYVQGMLATQLNHMVNSGQIAENTVIRVNDFMNNFVQGKNVIILLKIEVLNNAGQRLGNPQDISKQAGAQQNGGGNAAAPPAKPMYGTQVGSGNQGMYGNTAQQRQQPLNSYGGGGNNSAGGSNPYGQGRLANNPNSVQSSAPIVRSSTTASGQPITPINALNMYQNRWTIRARVTNKSDIRTWSNARGEGSLFSVELLDASGMDIRATFFKEAVDKFYQMLSENSVYTFTGGRLKVANMQYNTCKSQYEITFDQNAEIHLDNDTGDIQMQHFDFVSIAQLESVEPGTNVDVIGVVKSVGAVQSIISKKSGKEMTKCDLVLADDSGVEVNLTVWGDKAQAAQTDFVNCPVVAFRRARVSDYGGRSLSGSSGAMVNPRIPECDRLQSWWGAAGNKAASRSLSSSGGGGAGRMDAFDDRKTVSAIKDEQMGYNNQDGKPEWLSFKGTFNFLKKDKEGGAWYPACPNSGDPCKNLFKVSATSDGNWHCDKCQQTTSECVYRFIFSATVTDDTSTTWVSLFNEQAETMFSGVTAQAMQNQCFGDNYDQDAYDSYFAKANYTDWIIKCKVKLDNVGDEQRVKASVVSLQPVDYVKESKELLRCIAAF